MPQRSIRFGVTDHAGRRSETWKCWTEVGRGRRDVYVACREPKPPIHLSLHEQRGPEKPARWHVALVDPKSFDEAFEAGARPPSRFAGVWERPAPIAEGITLGCRVHVPWYTVTMADANLDPKVLWISTAPQGHAVEFDILLSERPFVREDWPGRDSMDAQPVAAIELDGGGCVWIVFCVVPAIELEPQRGVLRPFRGHSEDEACKDGIRAVMWRRHADGSVVFLAGPVTVTKNA